MEDRGRTGGRRRVPHADAAPIADGGRPVRQERRRYICERARDVRHRYRYGAGPRLPLHSAREYVRILDGRSEEHTSELQSLMRISYAVFCLKKKKNKDKKATKTNKI